MRFTFSRGQRAISFTTPEGELRIIRAWSKVRNELNGLRPRKGIADVCRSVNRDGSPGVPIMPRPFPIGAWRIAGFKEHPDKANDGYLYPVYIHTDAYNEVDEWELDDNGFYVKPTGRKVFDYYQGLHFSTSDWTQGCIRVIDEASIRSLWSIMRIDDEFLATV